MNKILPAEQNRNRKINNHLRENRKKIGVTLTEIALRAELTPTQVSIIERGCRCSQPTARRLADAMGEPVERLFPDYEKLRSW